MNTKLRISGEPQGKGRPRVTKNGTFTPRKTTEYEQFVQLSYRQQCRGVFFGTAPLSVTIEACFPVPKSASRRQRDRMIAGEIKPAKKPDADNIAKAICDALNGFAYHDDAQIVRITVIKRYAEAPCVNVWIYSMEE